MTDPVTGTAAGSVKSADRALAIIDFAGQRGSFTLSELLRELKLPRSSGHGLLSTLVSRGWLEHDPVTHTYRLGLHAWYIGQQYTGHHGIAELAKPAMDALRDTLGETVQLARLSGIENVYIAISESRRPMRLASSVGMRLHSHATGVGKALLSLLPPAEAHRRLTAEKLPRFTSRTITDPAALLAALEDARNCGYAVDSEEFLPGCRCVAVPVHDDRNGLLLALSVTAPTSRLGDDWPAGPVAELQQTAGRIRALIQRAGPTAFSS